MTTTLTLEAYRQLDKSRWTETIPKWNRRYGFTKKIPRASIRPTIIGERPSDERAINKRRKTDWKKPLIHAAHLDWDEVPTRLPYIFGANPPKWFFEAHPGANLDPNTAYIDRDFLDMVAAQEQRAARGIRS